MYHITNTEFITPKAYHGTHKYQDLKSSKYRSVFETRKGNLKIACMESAAHIGTKVVDAYNELLEQNGSMDRLKILETKTTWFKDNEVRVDALESVDGCDVYLLASPFNPANFYSENIGERKSINDYLAELLNGIDVISRHGGTVVPILLYFPYGRQDKADYMERQSCGAKLVAKQIEAAGAKHLIGFNFHAPQIRQYFDISVDEIDLSILFANYFKKYKNREDVMVIGPDAGSLKWIKNVARSLGLRYSSADKVRTAPNVAQVDDINADFRGIKKVLLLDDIVDTFGTGKGAIEFLIENTKVETVEMACFFPLMNDPAPERIQELINKGILTDLVTLPTINQREKVKKLPVYHELDIDKTLAMLINKRHYSDSVRSIFTHFKNGY